MTRVSVARYAILNHEFELPIAAHVRLQGRVQVLRRVADELDAKRSSRVAVSKTIAADGFVRNQSIDLLRSQSVRGFAEALLRRQRVPARVCCGGALSPVEQGSA